MGDYLVMQENRAIYKAGEANWMLPELQNTKSPSTTIGGYVKAMHRGGPKALAKYKDVAVDLPEGANAGGFRPGACNELGACMPAEIGAHTTGHDLRFLGALWEYMEASRALAMIGAIILAGWPAFLWGQTGMGPKPPSLMALVAIGVSMDILNKLIDVLFRLDNASPPMLWQGGALRPLMEACFASMVMYFDERKAAGEMQGVIIAMTRALNRCEVAAHHLPTNTPTVSLWGGIIRAKFNNDNLHLTARTADTGSVQLVAAVRDLGHTIDTLRSEAAEAQQTIAALRAEAAADRLQAAAERERFLQVLNQFASLGSAAPLAASPTVTVDAISPDVAHTAVASGSGAGPLTLLPSVAAKGPEVVAAGPGVDHNWHDGGRLFFDVQ
mmetsp:Transcript_20246/g.50617  ORF Transcript_20246/g.50617 Transcript_20246/m.50617 type:complete len:385 (+) Transcript_20246:648-1802(+)